MAHRCPRGLSLIELLLVLALASALLGLAMPGVLTGLDEARVAAAARHLSATFGWARLEAVKRSAALGIRFEGDNEGRYRYAMYVDGNGNGIRTADIETNIDAQIQAPERLSDRFPGVDFGIARRIRGIDSSEWLEPGSDPIRFGTADILTFTPRGTATPGTVYLHSAGGRQYAVRVLGTTGRTRVLELNPGDGSWMTR
jgi:prepilin-type N-terminal cleavage/methylation domain-containing protein